MKKLMNKNGIIPLPLVMWILGIYLLIGVVAFILLGAYSGIWSIQHLLLWPVFAVWAHYAFFGG